MFLYWIKTHTFLFPLQDRTCVITGSKYLELLLEASSDRRILFNGGKVSTENAQEILKYHLKRLRNGNHSNVIDLLKIFPESGEADNLALEIESIVCELRANIRFLQVLE